MDTSKFTEGNRQAWDATATEHRKNASWDELKLAFKQSNYSTFDKTMTGLLCDLPIQDKSVVQIGCNNGRELLSAMALGAKSGLGIDQSGNFIEQAHELTKIAKRDCTFTQANVYDLPETIPNDFDIAFITIGVLGWMPDLNTFFNTVANLLRPAGKLVIYETHPILEMYEPNSPNPYTPKYSYFSEEPDISDETIVYDDGEPIKAPVSYWFSHQLGQIINAVINSGLIIDSVVEYPHSNREYNFNLYTKQEAQLPMCFTLCASKNKT